MIELLLSGIEGVVLIDRNGSIRFVDRFISRMDGFSRENVIGCHVDEVFPEISLTDVMTLGRPVVGKPWMINGSRRMMSQVPVWSNGVIVGALGANLVGSKREANDLVRRIQKVFSEWPPQGDEVSRVDGAKYSLATIVGQSEGILEAKERVKIIASSNVPVLIQGDTGTGKELIAHALHLESARRDGPFVRVNCAGIPESLVESELFGYEEGAFTGARKGGKPGKFEQANQGSIFLDEIGELSRTTQAKLLRALQENEVERVGSTRLVPIDARVISATNQPLTRLVEEGRFRKDLMFRLAVFIIYIPPLKSRKEDIPLLCQHFIDLYNRENGTHIIGITEEGLDFLANYHWPGNVRELYITIERACLDARQGMINVTNILRYGGIAKDQYLKNYSYPGFNLKLARQEAEKAIIHRALQASEGNRQKAARLLGISRAALYNKMNELNIKE